MKLARSKSGPSLSLMTLARNSRRNCGNRRTASELSQKNCANRDAASPFGIESKANKIMERTESPKVFLMHDFLQDGLAQFSREQYRTLLEVGEAIAVHRDLAELFDDLAVRLPPI